MSSLIAEAEPIVIRRDHSAGAQPGIPTDPSAGAGVEIMGAPRAIYRATIPEAKPPTRKEVIKTANYYFSGMQKNDGNGHYPFTDDCDAIENGTQSTNVPL